MRLLQKEDIQKQKADERKREMDEGAKLAKRVDSLRELAATEQANLTKFRDASLEDIKSQVIEASQRLDKLMEENRIEHEKRKALRKPLDEEWKEVKAFRAEIEQKAHAFEEREKAIKAAIALNIQRERDAKLELGRAEDFRKRAAEEMAQANAVLAKARQDGADIRNEAQVKFMEAELRETQSLERELKVAIRERDAENKAKAADEYAQRLFLKEQELKDRWKVLLETEQNHD